MSKLDPSIIARLDRVQAAAADDLDRLISGFTALRRHRSDTREVDLGMTAVAVMNQWNSERMAYVLLAAVDRLTLEDT